MKHWTFPVFHFKMKTSVVLGLFLIFSLSNNIGFVKCTLSNFDLWKIIHELFPPVRPTTQQPYVILPVHPQTFPVNPQTFPTEPAKTEIPTQNPATKHVYDVETTTPIQTTTKKFDHSTQEVDKELKGEVLEAISKITDILLHLPTKTLTMVSVILPILGDIINILSASLR